MSTWFPDKETALLTGMYYVGRKDLFENEKRSIQEIIDSGNAKIVDGEISQFGHVHQGCMMIEFNNMDGVPVRVASTAFRNGFDCWLIDPKSGACVRV